MAFFIIKIGTNIQIVRKKAKKDREVKSNKKPKREKKNRKIFQIAVPALGLVAPIIMGCACEKKCMKNHASTQKIIPLLFLFIHSIPPYHSIICQLLLDFQSDHKKYLCLLLDVAL